MVTYPLNNIEYTAEDAELFHATRTSGIFATDSFGYSVTGADNTVVIGTGIGWIKNSEFSGKVFAQKTSIALDLGIPDSNYPRIDAIAIRFDANANSTEIIVKNGTAASNPVAPDVIRTESVYELHLYQIRREAGELTISPANITDLRLDSNYCGLMADSVTSVDTDAISKQVSALITSLQDEISNVKDGSAYLLRDGTTPMTGAFSMSGYRVTNLGTPVNNGDAVPKKYIDDLSADDVGALDISTKGTAIPSGANLDEYLTPGVYISTSSTNSATLTNPPWTNSGFKLVVMQHYTTTGVLQLVLPQASNVPMMCRYYEGGTWYAWRKVYDTGNKPTLEELGAFSSSGGTLNGNINVKNGVSPSLTLSSTSSSTKTVIFKNASASADYGTNIQDYATDGYRDMLNIRRSAELAKKLVLYVASEDGSSNATYPVIHTGNLSLITPDQIGAVALDGRNAMTGNLTIAHKIAFGNSRITDWGNGEVTLVNVDRNGGDERYIAIYDKTLVASPDNALAYINHTEDDIYNVNPILHMGNLAANGVARAETGSYVGTGTYGEDNPNSLTFGFEPKMVLFTTSGGLTPGDGYWNDGGIWTEGASRILVGNWRNAYFTRDGNTLSWYTDTENAAYQFNTSGKTYYYLAIG